MRKRARILMTGALCASVAGCAGLDPSAMDDYDLHKWDLDAVREMAPQGSAFIQGLRSGYLELADQEYASMDWSDYDHFARKAVTSARSMNVQPDQVALRELAPEHVDELTAARARMMGAFDREGRRKAPFASARAQTAFDCWLEQQEENDIDDIARCKADFEAAMAEVEDALSSDLDNVYVVFFAWDKAIITPVAAQIIDDVVSDVNDGGIARIIVAGHADTSGSAGYNDGISQRRAIAVADALAARGISQDMLDIEWFGETQLRVPTADGVREQENRRVEIRFAE